MVLVTARPAVQPMSASIRILGIDPGSRITGWGIIDVTGQRITHIANGQIRTDGSDFPARLEQIFDRTREIVEEYQPEEVAIERVFMHRNADSALKLGQARAAAICATFAKRAGIHEYAAREVKLAVVGTGAADKTQVQHMVGALLSLRRALQADSADALAVAICHANQRRTRALLSRSLGK